MGFRIRLIALTFVTFACLPAFSAPPEEEVPPEVRIANEIADLRRDLAGEHCKLARWCRGKKHKRTAHRHFVLALHFHPELKSLRIALGYRKVDEKWVLRRPVDLGKLEDKEAPGESYSTRDDAIRIDRVRRMVEIAKMARDLGVETESTRLLEKAVTIAPQDATVRRDLGHVEIGGRWFSPEEAAEIPREVAIQHVSRPSEVARALGAPLTAWKSGRFLYESRGTREEFQLVLEAAARSDGLCTLLMTVNEKPVPWAQYHVTGLGSMPLFVRYVDQILQLPPGPAMTAKKTGLLQLRQNMVLASALAGNAPRMADWWAHGIASRRIYAPSGRPTPAWLLSAFSDYISERIVGTMITGFFTVEHSAGLQLSATKPAAQVWRSRLRNLALLKEDPKSGILFSSSLVGMTSVDAMKAWSLVAFLIDRDHAAFARFLGEAARGKTIAALGKEFGLSPEALDDAWRAYIIEHG